MRSYTERVKNFFRENHIVADDQAPIFLSYIGGKTFDLLRDLLAPEGHRNAP